MLIITPIGIYKGNFNIYIIIQNKSLHEVFIYPSINISLKYIKNYNCYNDYNHI